MLKQFFSGLIFWFRKRKFKKAALIKVYDKKGSEIYLKRDIYRKESLPKQIGDAWNNPDALYSVLVLALKDGFFDEIKEATERLLEIDKNTERSHTVRSILLMKIGKLIEARELLNDYIHRYGKTGVIMTNLAKTYAEQGDRDTAHKLLWEALELDPNQDNGIEWWGAIALKSGGKDALLEAMMKTASITGSWRSQLFIARNHLEQGELEKALKIYAEVLSIAPNEQDAMMAISGDLGETGNIEEAISITRPRYKPTIHGPFAGLNLLQAYFELGDYENGLQLITELRNLKRYDLLKTLDQYQKELVKIQRAGKDF